MNVFRLLATVLILSGVNSGWSQSREIIFDHLSTEDGLSQNDVNCILQDRKGFMWFGTNDGLDRYDGYSFQSYRPIAGDSTSISSNLVQCMEEDEYGNIWIGTAGSGVNVFDPKTQKFRSFRHDPDNEHSLTNNHVLDLKYSDGRLWIGTLRGVNVFECRKEGPSGKLEIRNVTEQLIPAKLPVAPCNTVYVDSSGSIWLGSNRGLMRLIPPSDPYSPCTFEAIAVQPSITSISPSVKGDLVVATARKLMVLDPQTLKITTVEFGSFDHLVVMDEDVWISSPKGLAHYRYGADDPFPVFQERFVSDLRNPHSLSKTVLRTVYLDDYGTIWIGTNGGGVNKFNPSGHVFSHYKHTLQPGTVNYDKIRSIYEDKYQQVWVGTEGGGLNFLPKQQDVDEYQSFSHIPLPSNTFTIEEYSSQGKDYLLIGGQISPSMYRIELDSTKRSYSNADLVPLPIIKSSVFALMNVDNKEMWIGTYSLGLAVQDLTMPDSIRRFAHDPEDSTSLSYNIVRSLMRDKEGNIWIGTGHGLNRLSLTEQVKTYPEFERFLHEDEDEGSISHNYILALHQSRDGAIWVGTFGGGLNKFVPETEDRPAHFVHYTKADGMPNNVVKGILEDDQGFLWISTNKGLTRFDPILEKFHHFDTQDGLQSEEFSELAAYRRKNGDMMFGGVNGFNVFSPGNIHINPHPPKVVFTKFEVLNQPVYPGEAFNGRVILEEDISETAHIDLKYAENSFSVEFSGLHYAAPSKHAYAYRMEGIHDDWIYVDATKRFVTVTNLSPGTYTLEVIASNNDGVWLHDPQVIEIYVAPPWWQTWWAFAIYGLIVLVLLLAFRRYTIIGIKEKHDLVVEHLEKEKAEELQQLKLQFFTNISHELRTPLSLISGPMDFLLKSGQDMDYNQRERQYQLIQKNTHYLLRLVNQLLDFRKLDQGKMKLKVRRGNLNGYINEITEPFQFIANKKEIDFTIHKESEEMDAWFDPDILEKTMYNLLSNAFKFTPVGGKISVEIIERKQETSRMKSLVAPNWVEIRIRDNGPGISPENREQVFERFFKASQPSKNNKSGSGIGLSYTRELVELHHGSIYLEDQPSGGACFVVKFPKDKKRYKSDEIAAGNQPIVAMPIAPVGLWDEDEPDREEITAVVTPQGESHLPVMLVIDDHQDIREFIRSSMEGSYQILEAEDGAAGLELALEHSPDLILSDVMMPVMDGFQLCQELKSDPRTSHIPIIMLTAKSSEESEFEGLTVGADLYIRKPFNLDMLKLNIQNILQARAEQQKRFKREVLLSPEAISVTSTDEVFLKKAVEIIEEHMTDPDFNVEALVKEIGMSRSKLYLKLKALTGQTSSEFIRTVRLKRAVQLLETSDLTIKEIMYMTGFNTASYFSKCFKKQFGMVPSEYVKKQAQAPV
ncbi:two-component regulator propeller domain-containing protein [Pontibacter sp. G13]|uniref:two-component regulator propeller domain-containing protein n=1 Tax=Pontibacter sp. G13 TaxID=3074898 RepID=UPI002889D88A|nr:two-component regulator propeller domain-containing protein [Pontibacter sp. G13]WNJ20070.1 two-component regulator propeller domain-containing protein [Pontibacter sp. G13]